MNKPEIKFEDMPQILSQLMEMFKDMSIKVENINNKVNEMPRKPLTIQAAASIICKGKSTIYKLVAANGIPFHKKGRRLYFYEDELLEWINKTTPTDYKERMEQHIRITPKCSLANESKDLGFSIIDRSKKSAITDTCIAFYHQAFFNFSCIQLGYN